MVVTGLRRGGAETQVISLAREFMDHGHTVKIVSLSPIDEFRESIRNLDVTKLEISNTWLMILGIFQILEIVKEFRTDIIHSHMVHANIACRLVKLLSSKKVKLICTAHSINEGNWIHTLFYRITNPLSDLDTHVSQICLESYTKRKIFSVGKSVAVSNGVSKSNFNCERKEKNSSSMIIKLLSVGRLDQEKNHISLVRAFSLLQRDGKYNLQLTIVGDGEEMNMIRNLIQSDKLQDKVRLAGFQMHPQKWYAQADLFILPSKWEANPLTLIEASFMKVPIVATPVGGVSEIIENDIGGIITAGSSPTDLKRGIQRMLSLTIANRLRMAEYSFSKVTRDYELKSIAAKWLSIYNTLLYAA